MQCSTPSQANEEEDHRSSASETIAIVTESPTPDQHEPRGATPDVRDVTDVKAVSSDVKEPPTPKKPNRKGSIC